MTERIVGQDTEELANLLLFERFVRLCIIELPCGDGRAVSGHT